MKLLFLPVLVALFPATQAQISDGQLSREIKNQLTGTWSLVAVENTDAGGNKTQPYGKNPVGLLVFTEDGEYAIQILKAVRPKVAANDKNKATPEENAALVQGNNSHFGTYAADTGKQTISFHVQHAFYPNWEGETQVRQYKLESNVLSYTVTNTTNGEAVTAVVVWKKKK